MGHAGGLSGFVSELSASSGQGFQRGLCAWDLAARPARSSHEMVPVHMPPLSSMFTMFVFPGSAFEEARREHGLVLTSVAISYGVCL